MLSRILVAFALLLVLAPAPAKTKYSKITVEVRNPEGEPVDRAAVIIKRMKGNKVQRSFELRTSQQGTAPLPPLESGTFLVQIIAKGYQTFGDKYVISEPERTLQIQLTAPQTQFSVHGKTDPRKPQPKQ